MARSLLLGPRMRRPRTVALLVIALAGILLAAPPLAAAQDELHEGAVIESAEVQGIALDRLSPELRRDIQALADQKLSRDRIADLVTRIETELPDVVAAARDVVRSDGRVHVIFLIAPIGDQEGLASNINARYTIDRVEIEGIDKSRISSKLRDDLQALVGGRLDPAAADRLSQALEQEQPNYKVTRRISRADVPGRIVVTFVFGRSEILHWIPYSPTRAKVIYHSEQGWSGALDIRASFSNQLFGVGFLIDDNDDLIEENSGYWLRAENRRAGTRRLGMSFEFSRFDADWKDPTLAALSATGNLAAAYGRRTTADPLVTFAAMKDLRFTVGASVATLDSPNGLTGSYQANAYVAGVNASHVWPWKDDPEDNWQNLIGAYDVRHASTSLGSDLVYTRQLAQAAYLLEHRHNRLTARVLVGHLSGNAPLFERFSLGDSATLRGWDKYEFAPLGGSRMWYQSIEYSFRHFAYFFDAGSLWDKGTDARVRLSTGIGYHHNPFFVTLAVPLNANDVGLTFMIGVRSVGVGASFDKR